MDHRQQIDRGIELLKLCQTLQSEKDGVDRLEFGAMDRSKALDGFAEDIHAAILNMGALYKLYPMLETLADIGQRLAGSGKISVAPGDSYADAALDYLGALCALQTFDPSRLPVGVQTGIE